MEYKGLRFMVEVSAAKISDQDIFEREMFQNE